jgi:hypothetical protein
MYLPHTQRRLRRSVSQAGDFRFPVLGDQVPRIRRSGYKAGEVLWLRRSGSQDEAIKCPG